MSNQRPPRRTITVDAIARVSSTKELIRRVNEETYTRSKNLHAPRDIEALFTYEFNFLDLIGRKFDALDDGDRNEYTILGFRFDEFQSMRDDRAIAQSWIDWYKHKRLQEIESIKAIEDHIPTLPEFGLSSIGHPCTGWAVFINTKVPEFKYRLRQAAQYSRTLYNIFCAPGPAPAPGNPLPVDLPVPDFSAPAPKRFPHRDYIFAGDKTYSEDCGKLIDLFLIASIKDGYTSDLLPFVPR